MEVKNRFVHIPDGFLKFADLEETHDYYLMLVDYMWYTANEQEIVNWMIDHNVELAGMIIKFRTEEDRTLFLLRWS